jgi:hypothetical protein
VALVYRQGSKDWHLEGTKSWGPNVIRTVLVEGDRQTVLIGAYIPPEEDDGTTLQWIRRAYNDKMDTRPTILMGDLNANLNEPASERDAQICATVASFGLYCVHEHFGQRRKQGWWTWSMRRKGKTIRSKPDYVLVEDKRFFKKAYAIKPRGLASDHKMLVVQYSPTDTARKFY